MKICIATPMYGGNAKSLYVSSMMELLATLNRRGHQVFQTVITNESLITRARNTLVHEFLKTNADAILFIDADHGFKSEEVADMVESGKDLIGGIYPMKAINWENVRKAALAGKENLEEYSGFFAVNFLQEEQTFSYNQPFKVRDIGTGMMFVTRKVFEALKPVCKAYKNNSISNGSIEDATITEYFTTMIDPADGILLSEDYALCYMWRELGNDIWAAPWVNLSHAGDYNFSGKFLRMLDIQRMSTEAQPVGQQDSLPSSDTTSADSE
jgi:hypothetical protein